MVELSQRLVSLSVYEFPSWRIANLDPERMFYKDRHFS